MTKEKTTPANLLLSHPLLLRAAWKRVERFLSYGVVKDDLDHLKWITHPNQNIYELSQALKSGTYKPAPFTLIPHPKKNAILRHYVVPSIRDQVAFAAYGILLAPCFESRMPNVSFGNRWYRGVYRSIRDEEPKWKHRNFSLTDSNIYQPFRRAHGLYKRVAHWSVSRMLGESPHQGGATGHALTESDYTEQTLPPFVNREWWNNSTKRTKDPKAYWCTLDLQLAYPSVSIEILQKRMLALLEIESFSETDEKFGARVEMCSVNYPSTIRDAVSNKKVQKCLAFDLCEHLKSITYVNIISPDKEWNYWQPSHVQQTLPSIQEPEHTGIPTGLAISGLLLNIYLTHLDLEMTQWITKQKTNDERPSIYLRFADDMTLIAPTIEALLTGIEKIWKGINWGEQNLTLAHGLGISNLTMNWAKVGPTPMTNIIQDYLKDNGWNNCKSCGQLHQYNNTTKKTDSVTLSSWWDSREPSQKKLSHDDVKIIELNRNNLGPFVTYLVERMSALGNERFDERFGHKSEERLNALHELIRFDLDDIQVRTDTRMSYAANRLTSAWLPNQNQTVQQRHIYELRESVAYALLNHPWKASLWRAAIRVSLRRPFNVLGKDQLYIETYRRQARSWLESILERIAIADSPKFKSTPWIDKWPEKERESPCDQPIDPDWKVLYLSYLRTTFWHSLAETITSLRTAYESTVQPSSGENPGINSQHWLFRAMPESFYKDEVTWISNLDVWAKKLYPKDATIFPLPIWEINSIAKALLATSDRSEVRNAAEKPTSSWVDFYSPHHKRSTKQEQKFPFHTSLGFPRTTLALFPTLNRVFEHQPNQRNDHEKLDSSILIHSMFAKSSLDNNSETALARDIVSTGNLADPIPEIHLEILNSLELLTFVPLEHLDAWWAKIPELIKNIQSEPSIEKKFLALNTLYFARKLFISANRTSIQHQPKPNRFSLYGLLWSTPECLEHNHTLQPSPTSVPAIGLPTRVALHYFQSALAETYSTSSIKMKSPPLWTFFELGDIESSALRAGRKHQFGNNIDIINTGSLETISVTHSIQDWDFPPHPLMLLPVAFYDVSYDDPMYQQWVHVLHLLFSLDGHEDFLDSIFNSGLGNTEFHDRWNLRGRIHLPKEVWECLDKVSRFMDEEWAGISDSVQIQPDLFSPGFNERAKTIIERLIRLLDKHLAQSPSLSDFVYERVDVRLDINDDYEQLRTVRPHSGQPFLAPKSLPVSLLPDPEKLSKSICIRIGQTTAQPDWKNWLRRFPRLTQSETLNVMGQITRMLSDDEGAPDLLVLPEIAVPERELYSLSNIVRDSGIAIFTGLMWRILPPVSQPHHSVTSTRKRIKKFFVNEASLLIPLNSEKSSTSGVASTNKLSIVREFRFRKPLPATSEHGLSEFLSTPDIQFSILSGSRWFRFIHAQWGDFAIGICSDLLDPSPWRNFRGEVLHTFLSAFNQDVDLYDSLSWVRAYETFSNVVVANHGSYGGSFAWSPKRSISKEVARLRGGEILLTSDIILPVKELYQVQCLGEKAANLKAGNKWQEIANGKPTLEDLVALDKALTSDERVRKKLLQQYKSVPPKYIRFQHSENKPTTPKNLPPVHPKTNEFL